MASLTFWGEASEVILALEREREWVVACRDGGEVTDEMRFRRDNLVSACVRILGDSPGGGARYSAWIRRNPQWVRLIRDYASFIASAGNKALLRLVDLVLSDLVLRSRLGWHH